MAQHPLKKTPSANQLSVLPVHGILIDAELAARHQAFLAAATADKIGRAHV